MELSVAAGPLVEDALLNEKLVIISAGTNVIRMVPPLIITREHVDAMLMKLETVLKKHS